MCVPILSIHGYQCLRDVRYELTRWRVDLSQTQKQNHVESDLLLEAKLARIQRSANIARYDKQSDVVSFIDLASRFEVDPLTFHSLVLVLLMRISVIMSTIHAILLKQPSEIPPRWPPLWYVGQKSNIQCVVTKVIKRFQWKRYAN